MSNQNPAGSVEENPPEPFQAPRSSRYPTAIWLSAGLSASLLLGIGAASFALSRKIDGLERVLSEVIERAHERERRFQMAFLDELAGWNSFQLRPTQRTLREIIRMHAQTRRTLANLSSNDARIGPEFSRYLDALRTSVDLWSAAPVALMSGRMSFDEFKQLPQRQGLSIDVMAKTSQLGAVVSGQMIANVAELRRLEQRRGQILAGLFPLALLGIVLTAWFARKATLSHQRLLENSAQAALVRDAMAPLTGDEVLPTALHRIAYNAMRIAQVDGAFLEQSDDARSAVKIVTAVGTGAPPEGSRVAFVASITDEIVRAGATELSADLTARVDELGRLLEPIGERRYALAVPLNSFGDVHGALVLLQRERPIRLKGEALSRLHALSAWADVALRRQRLANELRLEHARLEAVIEEMPLGVVLAEAPSGRITLLNRQAVDMWGSPAIPPQSVEEYGHWQLFQPNGQEYEAKRRPLARSILTGETIRGEEAEIRWPDGHNRTVRINSAPIRDERGGIIAGVGTIDDVSEEKRREQQARFLDEISRQLASTLEYDATMDAILHLMVPRMGDAAAIHHLEDHTVVRKWSVSVDDAKMREQLDEIDRDPLPLRSAHPVAVAIRTGKAQLREKVTDEMLKAIARDETHLTWLRDIGIHSAMAVPLIVRAKPIGALLFLSMHPGRRYRCEDLDLAEEIGRRAALAIDNAHLFRTMNQAEQVAHFLADAANTLSTSLQEEDLVRNVTSLAVPIVADFALAYLWSDDGPVRYAASAHRDPSQQAMLEEAARLYQPDPNNPRATVPRALRTAQPVLVEHVTPEFLDSLGLEPRVRQLLGELAPVSWLTVPLVAHGKTLGAITLASVRSEHTYSAEDLTFATRFAHSAALAVQNARLFRTVEDAVTARDEVLAIVSHDLRNPLSTIKMSAELLSEIALDEAHRKRRLDVIVRATGRMTRLIQDLLDVVRVESGKRLIIEQQRVRPAAFIREACESFVLEAREKQIRFDWTVPDELPDVLIDVGRMIQVLSNLIGNALKFTPEGGHIEVQALREKEMIRVSVKDSGPGIPPEHLERIFRPFWQVPRAARHGTGLGLPIVRVIVEHHGGRVWVQSEEGVGSTFHFTLPEAPATKALAA